MDKFELWKQMKEPAKQECCDCAYRENITLKQVSPCSSCLPAGWVKRLNDTRTNNWVYKKW